MGRPLAHVAHHPGDVLGDVGERGGGRPPREAKESRQGEPAGSVAATCTHRPRTPRTAGRRCRRGRSSPGRWSPAAHRAGAAPSRCDRSAVRRVAGARAAAADVGEHGAGHRLGHQRRVVHGRAQADRGGVGRRDQGRNRVGVTQRRTGRSASAPRPVSPSSAPGPPPGGGRARAPPSASAPPAPGRQRAAGSETCPRRYVGWCGRRRAGYE